ncbi:LmeA family phospholipid-binding protein [Corynebacterium pacaense]|uniref:LmeA family phospholipid-binding protein n=1 Tax=Corynebacterium pacaense TaxID=1816684 RepID=UPI0009BAC633|nr:DUF2993 domain-containing protein [Corynebacterium pacaense]
MSKPPGRPFRAAIATALTVLVLGAVLWVADSVFATRAERHISESIAEEADLETSPRVYAGGAIYLSSLVTGTLDTVTIDMLDVDVPGIGMVNASTVLDSVTVTPAQVLSGDLNGSAVELFSRTLRLDGVALGSQLGITDLDISNPLDVSPTGGSASEAQLSGTPTGFAEPVAVVVTLRLVGSEFHMTPVSLVDGPDGTTLDDVVGDFTWSIDTTQLPLANRVNAVKMMGGSIYFESQARNVIVSTRELSPLAAPEDDSDS